IADTKALCKGLKAEKTEGQRYRLFNLSTPPMACAVLMRDFLGQLDHQEREFCRDVLAEYATLPLRSRYEYQFGDGVGVAIEALPLLLADFPESRDDVMLVLLLTLCDPHSVGMNRRFADYALS